jgi:hypothetical protein
MNADQKKALATKKAQEAQNGFLHLSLALWARFRGWLGSCLICVYLR